MRVLHPGDFYRDNGGTFFSSCLTLSGVRQALVSEIVDTDTLPNAVALNSSIFNNASSVAPVIAGFLVATIGEGWCFAINGATYLAVIAGLLMMRLEEHRKDRGTQSALSSIREGFQFVHDTAPIRRILVVLALVSLLGAPFTVLMPIFADKILHAGPRGLGFLMSAVKSRKLKSLRKEPDKAKITLLSFFHPARDRILLGTSGNA